jgi:hypothetical protein
MPQVEAPLRRLNLGPVTPSASLNSVGNENSTPQILIDQVWTAISTTHSTNTIKSRAMDANDEGSNAENQRVPSYVLTASPPEMHQRLSDGEVNYRHEDGNAIQAFLSSSREKGGRRDSTLDSMSGAESDVGRGPSLGIRRSFTFLQQHDDALVQTSVVRSIHASAQPSYESGDDPSSSPVSRRMALRSCLR